MSGDWCGLRSDRQGLWRAWTKWARHRSAAARHRWGGPRPAAGSRGGPHHVYDDNWRAAHTNDVTRTVSRHTDRLTRALHVASAHVMALLWNIKR